MSNVSSATSGPSYELPYELTKSRLIGLKDAGIRRILEREKATNNDIAKLLNFVCDHFNFDSFKRFIAVIPAADPNHIDEEDEDPKLSDRLEKIKLDLSVDARCALTEYMRSTLRGIS